MTGAAQAVAAQAGIVESARLTGGLCYAELSLHQLLGSLAPRAEDPGDASFLAAAARSHAWRGRQLAALLPVSAGLPAAAELTASPSSGFDTALGLLATAAGSPGNAALVRRAVLEAVYPALADAYESRLRDASPAADAPLSRVIVRVLADLVAVRREAALGREVAALLPGDLPAAVATALARDRSPLGVAVAAGGPRS